MEYRDLGQSGLRVAELAVGTWAWGANLAFGKRHSEDDLLGVFRGCLRAGLNFFDTAEAYGHGKVESILGHGLAGVDSDSVRPVIGTKFNPQFRRTGADLRRALRESLRRLNLAQVDLYQIHVMDDPRKVSRWIDAIADAYQDGLVRAVGVSNYFAEDFKRAYELLDRRGIRLASNQMHLSLLYRKHETSGLLRLCRELGVAFLAYMPLEQGVLTGKYTAEKPPPGLLRRFIYPRRNLERVKPLIRLMAEIGAAHACDGEPRPVAQVALNWVRSKGALPLVGITGRDQLQSNLGTLEWSLTAEETARLDETAVSCAGAVRMAMWRG